MGMVGWMYDIKASKELRERPGIYDIISVLQQNRLWWYEYVLQKEDNDLVKKCAEYKVEGSRPRGRPKRTRTEVLQNDCQARKLNRENAMDCSRWRKLKKDSWWSAGVSGWMFVMVPAHLGSHKGSKMVVAVEWTFFELDVLSVTQQSVHSREGNTTVTPLVAWHHSFCIHYQTSNGNGTAPFTLLCSFYAGSPMPVLYKLSYKAIQESQLKQGLADRTAKTAVLVAI